MKDNRTILEILNEELDWGLDDDRMGQLIGEEQAEREMVGGRVSSAGSLLSLSLLGKLYRSGVGIPAVHSTRAANKDGFEPVRLTMSSISKMRPQTDVTVKERSYFDIPKGRWSEAIKSGALVQRNAQMLYAPKGSALETKLSSQFRQKEVVFRQPGANERQRGTAPAYIGYIERPGAVEDINQVPAVVSNLPGSQRDRARFFENVEKPRSEGGLEREDGVVQMRIIAELPHDVSTQDRVKIVLGFSRIFEERGLPFVAALHLPDKHGDARNYHVHIAYHDRPFHLDDDGNVSWMPKKCRDVIGPAWIKKVREAYAEAANNVLQERGKAPRYDAGSYKDLGIDKTPHLHMGPKLSAMERRGVPTLEGIHNLVSELAWSRDQEQEKFRSFEEDLMGGLELWKESGAELEKLQKSEAALFRKEHSDILEHALNAFDQQRSDKDRREELGSKRAIRLRQFLSQENSTPEWETVVADIDGYLDRQSQLDKERDRGWKAEAGVEKSFTKSASTHNAAVYEARFNALEKRITRLSQDRSQEAWLKRLGVLEKRILEQKQICDEERYDLTGQLAKKLGTRRNALQLIRSWEMGDEEVLFETELDEEEVKHLKKLQRMAEDLREDQDALDQIQQEALAGFEGPREQAYRKKQLQAAKKELRELASLMVIRDNVVENLKPNSNWPKIIAAVGPDDFSKKQLER